MKLSTSQGMIAGYVGGLALLVVLAGLTYHSTSQYVTSVRQRRQAVERIQRLAAFRSLLQGAEASQRGYLLTASPKYLDPYNEAAANFRQQLDELRAEFPESHPAHEQLAELETLSQQRFDQLAQAAALRRQGSNESQAELVRLLASGVGKKAMDENLALIATLERQQAAELDQINARVERVAANTMRAVTILCPLAVVLLGSAVWVLRRDLRRREAAEAALEQQRVILSAVVNSITEGVIVVDEEKRLALFNPAAERMHGIGLTSLPPESWSESYGLFELDRVTPLPRDKIPVLRALRGETIEYTELYQRLPGEVEGRYFASTGGPIVDEFGRRRGGVVVVRDVTQQRKMVAAMQELNNELERRVIERTQALAQANEDLAQRNQENELFVYSVSHDLRSPLVNLQGFSQELGDACEQLRRLAESNGMPPEARDELTRLLEDDVAESLHFIRNSVARLSNIIDALLRLSRAGRVVYQWQVVDIGRTVERVVDALQGTLIERQAAIEIHPLPDAWGDPAAVEQVFANLVQNALHYLSPDRPGQIEIGAQAADDTAEGMVTYFVRDNGIGIPESLQKKVFTAFQRLNPDMAPGEGMGLALVERIVKRHAGRVWVESTPGAGSTFYLTLPAASGQTSDFSGTLTTGDRL